MLWCDAVVWRFGKASAVGHMYEALQALIHDPQVRTNILWKKELLFWCGAVVWRFSKASVVGHMYEALQALIHDPQVRNNILLIKALPHLVWCCCMVKTLYLLNTFLMGPNGVLLTT